MKDPDFISQYLALTLLALFSSVHVAHLSDPAVLKSFQRLNSTELSLLISHLPVIQAVSYSALFCMSYVMRVLHCMDLFVHSYCRPMSWLSFEETVNIPQELRMVSRICWHLYLSPCTVLWTPCVTIAESWSFSPVICPSGPRRLQALFL